LNKKHIVHFVIPALLAALPACWAGSSVTGGSAAPVANWYPGFDATWKDAMAQGSETGNPTTHHCRAAELTDNDPNTCPAGLGSAGAEFDDTNNYIPTKIGQSGVRTTAYPFGDTDYEAAAASRFMAAPGHTPRAIC
jgi:hypothetical protein